MRKTIALALICTIISGGCISVSGPEPAILPKGENENTGDFYKRLQAQEESAAVILPKGENESTGEFYQRLKVQKEYTPR